jgi:hypothetical protein
VKVANRGGVDEGLALDVGEPAWDGDDDVRHGMRTIYKNRERDTSAIVGLRNEEGGMVEGVDQRR